MPQLAPHHISLWRDADFLKFWAARTTSTLGRLMSVLPLVAILVLDARPYQMAILGGATTASGLAFGLIAGVWVDRTKRRPVLIVADVVRAVSISSLPIAYFMFELRIEHLYVVAFVNGSLGIFHDVAYRAYLPGLVGRSRIQEANAKVSASESVVEQIAFSVAGFIAQLATAIIAGVVQSVTFALSGLLVLLIRKNEPPPHRDGAEGDLKQQLASGYKFIVRHSMLMPVAVSGATLATCDGIVGTLITLFAITEIGFQPGPLGLIYAVGGISSFFGALFAARLTSWLGFGRSLSISLIVPGLVGFLIPLSPAHTWVAAVFFLLPQILGDGFWALHDINQLSLQQAVTPENLRGRVSAAIHLSETAAALLGVTIAGVAAELIGLRWALAIGFSFQLTAGLVYLNPAIRQLRTLPEEDGTIEGMAGAAAAETAL